MTPLSGPGAWLPKGWSTAAREAVVSTVVVAVLLLGLGLAVVRDFSLPLPVVFLGVITGMTYGIMAVGLVLVYRSSRVINFAHGEVGAFAASLFGVWVADSSIGGFSLPYWAMLPIAMAVGAGVSMGVEALAVRRLRTAPKVMSLVMTLGVATFLLLLSLIVNTIIRSGSQYPQPPGLPSFQLGALRITPEYTAMLVATPLLVAGLALFLAKTRYGIALRASAENPDSALMSAIPSGRMSSLAWGLAGAVAAFAAVLQFPSKGFVIAGAALGPGLLVRALLAAVVARLVSLPVAFGFGVAVGVIEQATLWNTASSGPVEVLIFCTLLLVLLLQSREGTREGVNENWVQTRGWGELPAHLAAIRKVRLAGPLGLVLGAVAIVAMGLSSNRLGLTFTLVIAYTLVGLSIYVVTGLSGQLSLGQFAVAGVGALVSLQVVEHVIRSLPLGILAAGLAGAATCLLIGVPALRIRGMLLAVTTLSFAVAAEAWMFSQPWAFGSGVQPPRLVLGSTPVGTARGYYLFALPFLAGALWLVRNLSRGGAGRTLRAIRDNEDAARAFGIAVTRQKVSAFAFAGFLAGVGGALYGHGLPRLSAETFTAAGSITVVAITLIGGLALLAGPLLGALYLLALPALIRLDEVGLAVSTLGWVTLLLYYPGGLAQALKPLRDRLLERIGAGAAGTPPEVSDDEEEEAGAPAAVEGPVFTRIAEVVPPSVVRDAAASAEVVLEVTGVAKAFGGVQAVRGVTLQVREGETVGIIGPNGAGKTTLFEIVSGFTAPDEGSITFAGRDVTRLSAERRARLGLVRSFQDARLFPTLTVRETIGLALERVRPTDVLASATAWPGEALAEERKRAITGELIRAMGLLPYADRVIAELSTGTRRITELVTVAAMRPRVLLLDEPSSGVAQRETEALGEVLAELKRALDVTVVVIEHDMPLVLGISDRIIAMDTGAVIADGTPEEVVADPAVITSYLGGDSVAFRRSGSLVKAPPVSPRGGVESNGNGHGAAKQELSL